MATSTSLHTQAVDARKDLDWRAAALLFTLAADEVAAAPNPHQAPTANEIGLRRDAHLCLNRTPEFQAYRERMRGRRPQPDLSHEWLNPQGSLVRAVLGTSTTAGVRLRAGEVAA
jgi:hypothetical protein